MTTPNPKLHAMNVLNDTRDTFNDDSHSDQNFAKPVITGCGCGGRG